MRIINSKLITILILFTINNILITKVIGSNSNDTIFIFEEIDIYDTIFVYDTIWKKGDIKISKYLEPKSANKIFQNNISSNINLLETATLSQKRIIPVSSNQNSDEMKKFSLIALTVASLNLSGQEIGFKTSWQNTLTEIKTTNRNFVYDEMAAQSNYQYTLFGKTKITRRFIISSGIGYSEIHGEYKTYENEKWSGGFHSLETSNQLTQHYINIPLSLQYNFFWTINLDIGIDNNFKLKENEITPWAENMKTYDPSWYAGINFSVLKYIELGANIGQYFVNYSTSTIHNNSEESVVSQKHWRSPQFYLAIKYPLIKADRETKIPIPEFFGWFYKRTEFGVNFGTGLWWQNTANEKIHSNISNSISLGTYLRTPIIENYIDFKLGVDFARLYPTSEDMFTIFSDEEIEETDMLDPLNESLEMGSNNFSIPILFYFAKYNFSPFIGLNYNYHTVYNNSKKHRMAYYIGVEQKIGNRFSASIHYQMNNKSKKDQLYYYDNSVFDKESIYFNNNQIRFTVNYLLKNNKIKKQPVQIEN